MGGADREFGPEWIPADDPLNVDVRWLVARGELPTRFSSLQPMTRIGLAEALTRNAAATPSHARLRLGRELAAEIGAVGGIAPVPEVPPAIDSPMAGGRLRVRAYAQFDGVWRDQRGLLWGPTPRIGVNGTLHLSDRVAIHQNLFAGDVEGGRNWGDALVAHTDFLIFVEDAYIGYETTHISARFGRSRSSWGPGASNLLIGRSAGPFDHFVYDLRSGPWYWRALTGVLQHNEEKNAAAHRLEWSPSPRWSIAISEGAIFQGNPAQPLYVLGIVPYAVIERVQGNDAFSGPAVGRVRNNVIYALDVTHRMRAPVLLWAALLVDDVGTETSDLPSRLGYQAGGEFVPRYAGAEWSFGFEASKVYNYAYSVYYENSDWSHQERPLGHDEGNDFESLRLRFGYRPSAEWGMDLELEGSRHGEGRVGLPWYPGNDPRSAGNATDPAEELSGVIERRSRLQWGLQYDPSAAVSVRTELGLESLENSENREEVDEERATLRLLVRLYR